MGLDLLRSEVHSVVSRDTLYTSRKPLRYIHPIHQWRDYQSIGTDAQHTSDPVDRYHEMERS